MSAYEAVRSALEYQFSQLIDETGHDAMDRAAMVVAAVVGAREEILSRAIKNVSYALDPNQGERPDPVVAYLWLRTTFPPDHPNYVGPNDPRLAGTDFARREQPGEDS